MPGFVLFVFGAVVFGAGAMLAPALPTRSPRIGLAAATALAFVIAGAVFYASAFGWDTLVIDYLWFAVIVGIFLSGTFSAGMFRAENEGGTREYRGWPGPRELLFFVAAGAVLALPALTVPVPLDTDAQGFGYLALLLKKGGDFTSLAPYYPEVNYLYSPGLLALVAYLGTQLNSTFGNIQLAVGAVLGIVFVWLAYDFGNEISESEVTVENDNGAESSRAFGMLCAIAALIGTGLYTALLDSHYTALLGLVFSLAFLTYAIRFARYGKHTDFVAGAIVLAAVPLAQPDMTIVLILGFGALVAVLFIQSLIRRGDDSLIPAISIPRWILLTIGIPALAVIGIAPWLADIAPLLGSDIRSPFAIDPNHWIVLTAYHGGLIVVLALIGIVTQIGSRSGRSVLDVAMLIWLILIIDFSTTGILKAIAPWIPLFKYDYPFSIAWHGPIIPYLYFGAHGLNWLRARIGIQRADRLVRRLSGFVLIAVIVAVAVLIPSMDALVAASKNTPLKIYGAFSSRADLAAMSWLKANTPADALILNHVGDHEGDWTPLIAERNTVFFRPQPFFRNTEALEQQWMDFRAFWADPTIPAHADLLRRYGVDYVIVPQIVNQPESVSGGAYRWRDPVPNARPYLNAIRALGLPYLTLVFEQDGAEVYQVVGG